MTKREMFYPASQALYRTFEPLAGQREVHGCCKPTSTCLRDAVRPLSRKTFRFYIAGGARKNLLPEPSGGPLTCTLTLHGLLCHCAPSCQFIRCTELHPIQPGCNKSCLHEAYHIQFFFFFDTVS